MKYLPIILILLFSFCCFSFSAYSQYHIIGMNKVGVQSVVNQKEASHSISDKTIGFSPNSVETWIWTDTKEGLKYVAYFGNNNLVQNCLVIPINVESLNKNIKMYNTIMGKASDTSWITPSNLNNKKCLIVLMPTNRTPNEYSFFIGAIDL